MIDPADWKPARLDEGPPLLIVIIDTEEEFPWNEPFSRDNVSTRSIAAQARAQRIFEKYGIRPTYVIDYPVASQESGFGPLREYFDAGACQIGAHLHPWVNPPFDEPVNNANSYPGNLPRALEKAKLEILTDTIGENFGRRPTVYKAGRYGIGPDTAGILCELGYRIDASVVPETNFRDEDGPDFRRHRAGPHWIGETGLLEIPLTAGFTGRLAGLGWNGWSWVNTPLGRALRITAASSRLGILDRIVLTPEGITTGEHKRLTNRMLGLGHRVFSFTYHSPSLEPGCTPYVTNETELAQFLDRLDRYFDYFVNELGGRPSTPEEVLRAAR